MPPIFWQHVGTHCYVWWLQNIFPHNVVTWVKNNLRFLAIVCQRSKPLLGGSFKFLRIIGFSSFFKNLNNQQFSQKKFNDFLINSLTFSYFKNHSYLAKPILIFWESMGKWVYTQVDNLWYLFFIIRTFHQWSKFKIGSLNFESYP